MAFNPFLMLPPQMFGNPEDRGALEDDVVAINDIVLSIAPEKMSIYKASLNHEIATLRSLYTQKIKSGYGNVVVSMDIKFVGNLEINTKLRPLIAGLRATPFCVCYSQYLTKSLRGLELLSQPAEGTEYFLLRPLALALSSLTISTVPGEPASLSLRMEFSWFNYFPYMTEWVYKGGSAPYQPSTVFHSELWREFYRPFLAQGAEIAWPRDEEDTTPAAQIFFREYLTNPSFDAEANLAARDLIKIIKGEPTGALELINDFLHDKEVVWTSQNMWDVFWKKVGKSSLLKGEHVTDNMRARFKSSKVQDGAITHSLQFAGTGQFLKEVAQAAFQYNTIEPGFIRSSAQLKHNSHGESVKKSLEGGWNSDMQGTMDRAIRILNKQSTIAQQFEAQVPTEAAKEGDSSGYVPLPPFSVTHDYRKVKDGAQSKSVVWGRKRQFDLGSKNGIVVEALSITMRYNVAMIPMMAYRYPTSQYTGGIDISVSMALNCSNKGAAKLNTVYDSMESMAHRYRLVPQGYQNMWIKNDLLNCFNLKEFITQRIMTESIAGQPGRSSVIMELSHAPVLSTTTVPDAEELGQEMIWSSAEQFLRMANRLHEYTTTRLEVEGDALFPQSAVAYHRVPNFNSNDPKRKAFGTLVQSYCDIYNTALNSVFTIIFKPPGQSLSDKIIYNKFSAWLTSDVHIPTAGELKTVKNFFGSIFNPSEEDKEATEAFSFFPRPITAESNRRALAKETAKKQEAKAAESLGNISKDLAAVVFIYFISLAEDEANFGVLPNVSSMQESVLARERAKLGNNTKNPKLKRASIAWDREGVAKSKAHFKKVRNALEFSPEKHIAMQFLESHGDQIKNLFLFLETYNASLRDLTDKIQQSYLDLEEFRDIFEIMKKANILQGTATYKDFNDQLQHVAKHISSKTSEAVEVKAYNPDCYLHNKAFDGGQVNLAENGLLDAKVLEKAKTLSIASHNNAKARVGTWFSGNYYKKLSESSNTAPLKALVDHVNKDAATRSLLTKGMPGGQKDIMPDRQFNGYTHSIYSEQVFNNSLSEKPLKHLLVVDAEAHSHVNTPNLHGSVINSAATSFHTTIFDKHWDESETGLDPALQLPAAIGDYPPSSVEASIAAVAIQEGLDPRDLIKVAYYESKLNKRAVNPSGASGLFQIMPAVANKEKFDPFDPVASARYVARQMKKRGLHGYEFYLEHNQGRQGSEAIRTAADGGSVKNEKLGRRIEYNMANQPILFDEIATPEIRKMPKKPKEARLKRQQALADAARDKFTRSELAQLFLRKQRERWENVKLPRPAGQGNNDAPGPFPRVKEVRKDVTSTMAAPLGMAINEFQNDLYTGQAFGLKRAYPTFKLYFIEDDQQEHRMGFDDFFNYSAVQSIRVVRDRHIAADLCELYVTNLSGNLTNRKFRQFGHGARDKEGKVVKETPTTGAAVKRDTKMENPIASLMLQEGTHFSVYLGYDNDVKNLELVFTGIITEIEFMGSEEIIRILGQSYAVELVQDIKGFSKPKTTDNTGFGNLDFWGLGGNAYTGDLLEEMITQPEVLHFGRWTPFRKYTTPNRDLLTNKWHQEPKPQDDNIYAPSPSSELTNFADGIIFPSLRYTIYQTTIWDIFQEMCLRHPNYVAMAVPYRALGNDRMTMFYGLPNQLYFARDPDFEEGNKAAKMRREQETLQAEMDSRGTTVREAKQRVRDAHGTGSSNWGASADLAVMRAEREEKDLNKETKLAYDNLRNDRLRLAKEAGYIRPFRKYHLLTSSYHIVSNNIQANVRDVANTITVRYNEQLPGHGDIIEGVNNSDVALAKADQEVTVKLDAAIPDDEARTQIASFLNVSNENLARRYALGLLLRNTKNTYKGEIVILGNPRIKPHDVCYVFDEYNDMIGPIEVDRVIHVFTPEQGFLTEIKPSMLAMAGEWTLQSSAQAMGVVMEGAIKGLFNGADGTAAHAARAGLSFMAPIAAPLFDYFGGFMSDAILNYTQFGYPLVMSPLNHRGRAFAGGIPTHKLPKSMWKCIFGDWSPQAEKGFDLWLEDKIEELSSTVSTLKFENTVGEFWKNSNTLDVK